ncbi:hypothetical protein B0T16DRAFT_323733 [Cercophora newfieldiana]|uniref:Uncharacterized protein n=1 Tax=Cercophora newfieldiana TaxID=92897 RepID=A0AA39YIP7_9PEZI|nr:hypothetical protein B0T16DRAFT_323733 [Cercophora newfieldiana]
MSVSSRQIFASCEDADESDNPIEGTLRRATSVVASPVKEQPNTGRTRRDKRRDSISPLTDSDSTVHPSRQLSRREREREREKSISHNKKAMIPTSQQMRPPVKHSRTAPALQRRENEASYYGVSPVTTAATSRSRPQASQARPVSYYGNSRPPQANARFYAQQQVPTPPTSFPPPSWSTGPGPSGPFQPPPAQSPIITHQAHQAQDYFSRPLEDRFSSGRPQSSIGFRPPRTASYGGEYDDDIIRDREVQLARRPSASQRRLSKIDDDRKAMPPPPALRRPATARPTTLAFRPPPSTPVAKRRPFEEDDLRGDDALFQDISPLHPYDYAPRSRQRRPSFGATTVAYDAGDIRTEVAGSRSRRNSYYGGQTSSSGSGYEDKIRQATLYQEETGGPPHQLTAETLRKAARNASSSRSSGSYDESDYRQSATTRTTRSSNENEDVTIKIKGSATLKVGGTEMKCRDGAEINIASRAIPGFGPGSDSRSGYLEEERRPRIERPPTRARTNSQSGSYSRSLPRYDAPMGYGSYYRRDSFQQEIPPYPAYPGTNENFF